MMEKVPCSKCGSLILPVTAENNKQMCVPCARSEKLINKFLAKVSKPFTPLINWISETPGKSGGGCVVVLVLILGAVIPVSLKLTGSKKAKVKEVVINQSQITKFLSN